MTQTIDFEQIIIQGIKNLPKQYLGEVADFVVFLRQKSLKSVVGLKLVTLLRH
jgi:hypothetical protein